ncbi:FAD-dependent monooxygenase [Singulisphaera rosea]
MRVDRAGATVLGADGLRREGLMTGRPGRVLIVGAGPAGMALAYLLARRCVEVTALETHPDFARAFRGEGLQRSGIDVFHQMGLGEAFNRVPYIEMKNIEIDSGGRRVIRWPEPATTAVCHRCCALDLRAQPVRSPR